MGGGDGDVPGYTFANFMWSKAQAGLDGFQSHSSSMILITFNGTQDGANDFFALQSLP